MIPLPILLIHGFNGQPANWTSAPEPFPEFLAAQGFDPALIRLFSYGYENNHGAPLYNATGDIRAIAHRLDEADSADPETRLAAVEQLARDSIARGGPPKITIIAHSSGGLVARYYLSCHAQEDEFHTRYRGSVARLIMLGTPHLGVDIEAALDPLPTPLVFAALSHLHPAFPKADLDDIQEMRRAVQAEHHAQREFLFGARGAHDTAYQQFHPHSEFLRTLNRPGAMPHDIEYFNIAGDVRVCAAVSFGTRPVFVREKSLGDLLVSTYSACTIPNAPAESDTVIEQHEIEIAVAGGALLKAHAKIRDGQPSPIHRRLPSHSRVRAGILRILQNS